MRLGWLRAQIQQRLSGPSAPWSSRSNPAFVFHRRDVVGQRRRILTQRRRQAAIERQPARPTFLRRRSCAGAARRRTLAAWTRSHTTNPARFVRNLARALSPLEADVRRRHRHAGDGRAGRRRALARLPPQAEFLRSRRRHRARRCDSAHPLRAPRSPRRRDHQPQGARLLRRREHLHAARRRRTPGR